MNRLSRTILGASLLLALLATTACTPAVSFRQLKPGRFSLGKEPSIGLGTVKINPRLNLAHKESKGIVGALANVAVDALDTYQGSQNLRSSLETLMRSEIASNQFATYSSEPIYRLDLSGTVKVDDDADEHERKKKDGSKEKYVEITRSYDLDLRFDLFRTKDQTLVGGNTFRTNASDRAEGEDEDDATRELDDWQNRCDELLKDQLPKIMREILPYYVTTERKLREGDSDKVEDSAEMAEDGNIEGAANIWKEIAADANAKPKDRSAAQYNLAVYYESKADLEQAEAAYQSCAGQDDWCAKGVRHIAERRAELKRLAEVGIEQK